MNATVTAHSFKEIRPVRFQISKETTEISGNTKWFSNPRKHSDLVFYLLRNIQLME